MLLVHGTIRLIMVLLHDAELKSEECFTSFSILSHYGYTSNNTCNHGS